MSPEENQKLDLIISKLEDQDTRIKHLEEIVTEAKGMWFFLKLMGGLAGVAASTIAVWEFVKDHITWK